MFAGLELPGMIAEGQNIPIQNPVLGGSKTYTQQRMGTGFRVTHAFDRFNKYALVNRWTKMLSRVQKEGKDVEIHRMFNAPTATTAIVGAGYDTLDLAEAVHTGLATGSSDDYDNLLSAALSTSAVESAWYYFDTLIDDMGIYMGARPNILFYEPTLHFTANEIFKSVGKAHELSNTINVLNKEMDLQLYRNPRLSSTTAWGMIAKNDRYDVNVLTSQASEVFMKDAPDNTRDKIVVSDQYFDYGFGDPRMYYQGNT